MTVTRREFSITASLAAAGWLFTGARPPRAIAGPFGPDDVADFPIPLDKKLDPQWIASLTARGEPTVYSSKRDELGLIGMPIGGICTGLLYLGGDGRLWLWDIFNLPTQPTWGDSSGPHYAKPVSPSSPIEQGFALWVHGKTGTSHRRFDASGWSDISFRGEYPIGRVEYKDLGCPVEATLEAFSPFCPLDADDSGLPGTVMSYTVRNTSSEAVSVQIAGWLENKVSPLSGEDFPLIRTNKVVGGEGFSRIDCSAALDQAAIERKKQDRPDIVFETFEREDYGSWTPAGEAFGSGPRRIDSLPGYMGPINGEGQRVVNTHHTQNGEDVGKADTYVGTLTSKAFAIERNFISFRLGGGKHPDKTCVNLLIDGARVRTVTGKNSNRMEIVNLDVKEFAGRQAQLQVVDDWTEGWGQVGFDDVVFCDSPRKILGKYEDQPDVGTMSLGMIASGSVPRGGVQASINPAEIPASAFPRPGVAVFTAAADRPVGSVSTGFELAPGASATVSFVVTWHFARPRPEHVGGLQNGDKLRRHYLTRFKDSGEVAAYIAENFSRLAERTRLWRDTWYDSTLPYWFLDRAMASATTLATTTCFRFDNGRFYGWEGTYCCPGTCTHVWSYAHSVGRLFPELERSAREMADYGIAFHDDTGAMDYRAEFHKIVAHDGQCGTILRTYREHQMSADDAFLRRIWPRVKKAIEHMIREDKNQDGLLEGAQYNTLDTVWYGEMAWLSSYYMAALRAGAEMATEMADPQFAALCKGLADSGTKLVVDRLFNGEYFVHNADPAHPEANNTNDGCHTDQLMGQAWAWQVGVDRVAPPEQSVSALKSMWKYCFTPDVGPYRKALTETIKGGRWYAMPGEGGLVVCTFPKGGADRCVGKGNDAWAAGYFNECWTGFEHQVAGHMIYEGMIMEGMAIERMIEDRHHASRRNPWNEVECSSHYARSMSSHGAYLATCGFEYHGPKGHIGFAPRISPENFKAAFTGAEGWGSFSQRIAGGTQACEIAVKHGRLRLKTIALASRKAGPTTVKVSRGGVGGVQAQTRVTVEASEKGITLVLGEPVMVKAGESIVVELS
ncbi:MAG: hypothetical protein IT435_17245 [Phycisphaerales bacterium]|nr:hypothetical protein [Phycisphaerales bacterium]